MACGIRKGLAGAAKVQPILFHLGSVPIYAYGVFVLVGTLVGLSYCLRNPSHFGLNSSHVWNVGAYGILAGFVGSKISLIIAEWSCNWLDLKNPLGSVSFNSGGAFYGGVIAGVGMIAICAQIWKISTLSLLDLFATGLPLGHAVGRVGCFAAGCCYGKPTSLPWGVVFDKQSANQLS